MWKSKTRVTSYELQVQILELRAQIHELRVQIHELRVQINELVMPAITRKMTDLKNEILAKIYEKFHNFKSDFINEIKDQIKNEVSEAIGVEIKKREELKSTVAVLQQHVRNFQKQMTVLQSENEELEQYGRRLCIRVEGAPITDNETSEEVLKKVRH